MRGQMTKVYWFLAEKTGKVSFYVVVTFILSPFVSL